MNIEKIGDNNKLTLKVIGRLDTNTAPELDSRLKSELDNVSELIFDFSQLEYVSSAGLRVILATQKMMNSKGKVMIITNVQDMVMEVFDATGFTDILTIK